MKLSPLREGVASKRAWPAIDPYPDVHYAAMDFVGTEMMGRPFYKKGNDRYARPDDMPGWAFSRPGLPLTYAPNAAGLLIPFAANQPRLTDRGYLEETSRANLHRQSVDLANAAWVKSNGGSTMTVASPASPAAPDGTFTAAKLIEQADTGPHDIGQTTVTANGTYATSKWFKAAERTKAHIRLTDLATGGYSAVYDLVAGTATLDASLKGSCINGAARIIPYANGWFRCVLVQTVAAGTQIAVAYGPTTLAAGAGSYLGSAGSGVFAWGPQFELCAAGSMGETSYIPTGATAATRQADLASLTLPGLAYPFSAFCEAEYGFSAEPYARLLGYLGDSRALLNPVNAGPMFQTWDGVALALNSTPGAPALPGRVGKAMARFRATGRSISADGLAVTNDAVVQPIPPGVLIGGGAGAPCHNGFIRRFFIGSDVTDAKMTLRTAA